VFDILLALADQDRHGYAIMLEVERRTEGRVKIRAGSLYRALHRLLSEELVEEMDQGSGADRDDERRRYYRLTDLGRAVVRLEAERLARAVRAARAKKLFDTAR
jgi:DNA-binding PadR family transcriptional regulator